MQFVFFIVGLHDCKGPVLMEHGVHCKAPVLCQLSFSYFFIVSKWI